MVKTNLITLDNKLKVLFIPRTEISSLTIQLKGRAGSNFELENEIGAAHMLEHLVLQGSHKYPSPRLLQSLVTGQGGIYFGVTSRDDVRFGVKILKEDLEYAFEFLAEVFYNPLLQERTFLLQKIIIEHEILNFKVNPKRLIARVSNKILFPKSRMEKFNTGDSSDVEKLSYENILKFYKRTYFPGNFVVVVCGNAQLKDVKKLAKKYFENGEKPKKALSAQKFKQEPKLIVQSVTNESYKQAYVKIDWYGFRSKDSKKYPATYFRKIIDTYLKFIIKESLGLCYNINTFSFSAEKHGVFSIFLSTDTKNLETVFRNIKNILKNIHKLIDEAKISQLKKAIVAAHVYSLEKPSQIAGYYSGILLHGNSDQTYDNELKQYKSVKKEEIHKVADKLLGTHPKITVLSKNLKEKDIKEFWVTNA